MTDTKEVIGALRASRSTWENARGVPSALETIAADTIEALTAKLAEVETSKNKQIGVIAHVAGEWKARAEAAESALATARRDALNTAPTDPLADPRVVALVEAATELHNKAVENNQRGRSDIWPVIRKTRAALEAIASPSIAALSEPSP